MIMNPSDKESTAMRKKALIVEDDINIAELLKIYLQKDGFETENAYDGGRAVALAERFNPDIILLDIMLPVMDGWQVCREVRKNSQVPIIMLTAKGESMDKISGLEMGADDYVTKPFDPKELIARIHAVMRRSDGGNVSGEEPVTEGGRKLVYDNMTINLDSYELIVKGEKVDTPPKELELLFYLASYPNRVFTRNQLLDEVWGFDYFGDSRTVDVHVKRLREKIEGVSKKWELGTVWGVGYKFKVNEE
jgi:DNA-binding response OmpR family regulator